MIAGGKTVISSTVLHANILENLPRKPRELNQRNLGGLRIHKKYRNLCYNTVPIYIVNAPHAAERRYSKRQVSLPKPPRQCPPKSQSRQ